jgi:hypothetical protein
MLAGAWSRRISEEHRLVHLVDGDDMVILPARFTAGDPAKHELRHRLWKTRGRTSVAGVLEVGEALPDVGEAVGGVARVEVTQHDLAGPRARRGW